jgi:hypothetical protein
MHMYVVNGEFGTRFWGLSFCVYCAPARDCHVIQHSVKSRIYGSFFSNMYVGLSCLITHKLKNKNLTGFWRWYITLGIAVFFWVGGGFLSNFGIVKNTRLTGGLDDNGVLPGNQPWFYMTQSGVEEPVDVAVLYTVQESVYK